MRYMKSAIGRPEVTSDRWGCPWRGDDVGDGLCGREFEGIVREDEKVRGIELVF